MLSTPTFIPPGASRDVVLEILGDAVNSRIVYSLESLAEAAKSSGIITANGISASEVPLFVKLAKNYGKPYENVQLCAFATKCLSESTDNVHEAQIGLQSIITDRQCHHTPKLFALNQAKERLEMRSNHRSLAILCTGVASDELVVQAHATELCGRLIVERAPEIVVYKKLLTDALRSPANTPRSNDAVTTAEYAALSTVKVMAEAGLFQELMIAVKDSAISSLIIKRRCLELLQDHFGDRPEVATFLGEYKRK